MDLSAGNVIGEWIVEDSLGGGRFRCHRRDTPFRKAVLRELHSHDLEALSDEAVSLRDLSHPNIQGVLGVETSGDALYLVTENLRGSTLAAFVGDRGLPLKAALEVAVQVAEGLAAAHARGVAHRALRPSTVLLTEDGKACLVDFDLRTSATDLALDGPYVPPEGPGGDGDKADAYALGVLLFELFTHRPAPPGRADLRRALTLDERFPGELRQLVLGLTSPAPADRPDLAAVLVTMRQAMRESLPDAFEAANTFVDLEDLGERADDSSEAVARPDRIGRYEVIRELGRGGVGVVYEARDPDLHRHVALKVLLAGNLARGRDVERFLREARAVARLDHPHIVKILELGRDSRGAWFAMEYVEGPTLLDHVREQGRLPWRDAVDIAASLADALHHAHQAGLVHRDVKPNNVLIEHGQVPKLTDFGLALEHENEATRLTRTGQVLGTPMYMSPEQALGDLDAFGPPTDVYALGVVLFEALTGKVPFEGQTPLQVLHQVLTGHVPSPRELAPELPEDLALVVRKATEREIEDRYPTAEAFADELRRCLRHEPVRAARPTLKTRGRWFVQQHRTALGVALVACVASLTVVAGTMVQDSRSATVQAAAEDVAALERLAAVEARIEALRSDGDFDGADAAWKRFATAPIHRGTRAVVQGWMARGSEAAADEEHDNARGAFAMAYAQAVEPALQGQALVALGHELRAQGVLGPLPAVVSTLERRNPMRLRTGDGKRLARDAAAARSDLAAAAEHAADSALGPVLAELARATSTPHHATSVHRWGAHGSRLALHAPDEDAVHLVDATPALSLAMRVRLPVPVQRLGALASDPPALLADLPQGGLAVLGWTGSELVVQESQPWTHLYAAVPGDLDGDGELEHYLGVGRQLMRLRPADSGWAGDAPSPSLNATNSEIRDLQVADLDRDGRDDLAVVAGEWGAYDVRVYRGGEPELELVGRRKLGAVRDLAVLRTDHGPVIAVSKHDVYPNRRVFPEADLDGVEAGVWLLDGADLRGELALGDRSCTELTPADLDGDGADELLAGCGQHLLVAAVGSSPLGALLDGVRLRNMALLWVSDLDGDGDDELVVRLRDDGSVWVLGSGTEALPAPAAALDERAGAPEGTPRAQAQAWARAEDLAQVGQHSRAAVALTELAELGWGGPLGIEAVRRAATLREGARAHGEAGDTWMEAASQTGSAADFRAAARAYQAAHHDGERRALEAIEALGALDDTDQARLDALDALARRPVLTVDGSAGLPAPWEIEDPAALQASPAGLRVTASSGDVVARLPVVWDGGALSVSVELQIDRLEWGSGLQVGLVPAEWGDPLIGVEAAGHGGGEVVRQRVGCDLGNVGRHRMFEEGVVSLTLDVFPGGGGACSVAYGDLADFVEPLTAIDRPDGPWALVIRSDGLPGSLVEGTIRSLIVRGVEVGEGSLRPRDAARRALVAGDLRAASELSAIGDDPALSVALAVARGDLRPLVQALRAAIETDEGRDQILALLHARPKAMVGPLREVVGDELPRWWHDAWATALHAHRHDVEVIGPIADHLHGLRSWAPTDDAGREAQFSLLLVRGVVRAAQGEVDEARQDLELALSMIQDATAPSDRNQVAHVRLELASLEASAGHRNEAAAQVRAALEGAGSPEVVADMAAVRPSLQLLHAHPVWREVTRLRGIAP